MPLTLDDEAQKKLFNFLTPKSTDDFDVSGSGSTTAKTNGNMDLASIPTPPAPPEETPLSAEESQNKEKIQDSNPGHSMNDLSNVIQGYENQASKYGPDQEKAVLDQILKERGGVGRNIGRGIAAFTDTVAPVFGAGTGASQRLSDDESSREKMKLESVPTLQSMNDKQLSQKMALENMNPSSPMAQAKANAYQSVFKQLFPNMDPKTLASLTANPSIAEKIFPEIGPIVEKQIQMQVQKEGLDINRQRLQAETNQQGVQNRMKEQEVELAHPIRKALGMLPSALPQGQASPNVSSSTSTGPYGPTVQRNGSTYIWSPETGKYHKK
jgi:hypothetical protein